MKNINITAIVEGETTNPIGFKLVEPDGITLFYPYGSETTFRKDVTLTVEVEECERQ